VTDDPRRPASESSDAPATPDLDRPAPDAERAPTSDLLGAALGGAAKRAGLDPAEGKSAGHVVWHAMGGWRGILESVLPTLAFVILFTVTLDPGTNQGNLWLSLGVSVGIALIFTIVRLVTKSPPAAAIGGLIAVVAAAALALLTGRGVDNFVPGLLTNAVYGTVLLVSALVGWPLIGLAAGWLMNDGTHWRQNRRRRRAFFWLTIMWSGLFFARLAVQLPLYLTDNTTALGTLKLLMGLPLFAPLVAITWLAVRALYPASPK
jgi:hypothetical protein